MFYFWKSLVCDCRTRPNDLYKKDNDDRDNSNEKTTMNVGKISVCTKSLKIINGIIRNSKSKDNE